jgi:predicted phage terminase large subunit-like protein
VSSATLTIGGRTIFSRTAVAAEIERRRALAAEMHLAPFVRDIVWPCLEAGREYQHGWHIDAICLPGDVVITTRDGPRAIGWIVNNCWRGEVASFNHATSRIEWRPIKCGMKSRPKALLDVKFQDGSSLTLTGNHPLFTVGEGYVPAALAKGGDIALQLQVLPQPAEGKRAGADHCIVGVSVSSVVQSLRVCEAVYNIEVDGNNNYFADGILVHNCEHLEAVSAGQIRDLLITIPPRHLKSTISTIAWPAWVWVRDPGKRFLCVSYSLLLASEHAVYSRRLIESPLYQRAWGSRYVLAGDQNLKMSYFNNRGGARISVSMSAGSSATGRGGDVLVFDDPNNVQEIHSAAHRREVIEVYRTVFTSRRNDLRTGARVIIMQRSHVEDLAGYVLECGGFTHLCLPEEYEPSRSCVTVLGWKDPRIEEGELLFPARLGGEQVRQIKAESTALAYGAQYQQEPRPESGSLFKIGKIALLPRDRPHDPRDPSTQLPARPYTECRFWDCAATEPAPGRDPDYTVGARVRLYEHGLIVVMDIMRGRWGPSEGDRMMAHAMTLDGIGCRVREEIEGGSSGKKIIAAHSKMFFGVDYKGEPTGGKSKELRARPLASKMDALEPLVAMIEAPWNAAFIEELRDFPNGKHDDQVDSVCGAYNSLALEATVPQIYSQRMALAGEGIPLSGIGAQRLVMPNYIDFSKMFPKG